MAPRPTPRACVPRPRRRPSRRSLAVWTLAEDHSVYVVEHPGGAGNCVLTVVLDDLHAQSAAIAARGLEDERVTYYNGVRQGALPRPSRQRAGLRPRVA